MSTSKRSSKNVTKTPLSKQKGTKHRYDGTASTDTGAKVRNSTASRRNASPVTVALVERLSTFAETILLALADFSMELNDCEQLDAVRAMRNQVDRLQAVLTSMFSKLNTSQIHVEQTLALKPRPKHLIAFEHLLGGDTSMTDLLNDSGRESHTAASALDPQDSVSRGVDVPNEVRAAKDQCRLLLTGAADLVHYLRVRLQTQLIRRAPDYEEILHISLLLRDAQLVLDPDADEDVPVVDMGGTESVEGTEDFSHSIDDGRRRAYNATHQLTTTATTASKAPLFATSASDRVSRDTVMKQALTRVRDANRLLQQLLRRVLKLLQSMSMEAAHPVAQAVRLARQDLTAFLNEQGIEKPRVRSTAAPTEPSTGADKGDATASEQQLFETLKTVMRQSLAKIERMADAVCTRALSVQNGMQLRAYAAILHHVHVRLEKALLEL